MSISTDQVLVTSRDFDEYLTMFDLDRDQITAGRLLECPGGASDFSFRLRKLGGSAVAVDPLYKLSPQELGRVVDAELERGIRQAEAAPELYDLSWIGGIDTYIRRRERAALRFLADYIIARRHYVPAALPHLPFGDRSFTLALVPNLLFLYANLFDLPWHLAAIRELTRVADEVRIHPVTDTQGRRYQDLAAVRAQVAREGVDTWLIEVDYHLHKGPQWTLVCRPRP